MSVNDNLITGVNKMEYDYWILKMEGLVEPILIGPFTKEKCTERIDEYRDDPNFYEDSFTEIRVTKGAEIDV